MTEPPITTCITPNCEKLADYNSALCPEHKGRLQLIENELLANATRKIKAEMRQFEKLLYVEPPLHSAEIAHRMALPIKEVRKLLKKFKDDRA